MQMQVLETTPMVARQLDSLTLKMRDLLAAGAVITLGQPEYVEIESKLAGRTLKRRELVQPTLTDWPIAAHDGGAWIGFTLANGVRCRTASLEDTKNLRYQLEKEQILGSGNRNICVHMMPAIHVASSA